MFKTILMAADGTELDEVTRRAAFTVAEQFAGHVECLPVRYSLAELLAMAPVADMNLPMLSETVVEHMERQAAELASAVTLEFEKFCAREQVSVVGIRTPSRDMSGYCHTEAASVGEFVALARTRDLTVLPVASEADELLQGVTESCLFGTGRPILLAPADRPLVVGSTAVVGWNNSPEAARALGAAMPLLEKAGRIVVVYVGDGTDREAEGLEQVVLALKGHGLDAQRCLIEPSGRTAADAFFQFARGERAGFAVMGGYGHSRLREMVLGGFTRQALADAAVALLLVH